MADPTDAANKVAELTKGGPETWAGVTVSTGANLSVPQIPFSAASSTMTVRFWSPTAGTPVLLKVESASDPNQAAEVQALTTVAGGWETLSFDFAGLADPDLVYDKASLFPNFGTAGTGEVYYLDDLTYPGPAGGGGGGGGGVVVPFSDLTFDEAIPPLLTGFGGAVGAVVADPTDASNMVAQVVKTTGAETWAGTTVSTGANLSVGVIPFSASATAMTVRVWSPDAGTPVRLKAEDAANSGVSVETEATTTVAAGWETLTFDFANQSAGTAALNPSATYDKVSIFFDFGNVGTGATYYADDITGP